jgi:Membrane protease subunits, stomatin/prohibitin homologs
MRRDDGSDDDGGLLGELGGLVLKILRHGATVLAGGGKVIVAISVVTAMVGGLVGVQTVDPGERGVYVRNGEVMGTVTNGVHPTIPLIDRVRVFNMRTTTFSTTQDALTNDNINVNVSVTVRWDIRDGELERVYRDQAVNQEQLIELAVRDAVTSGIKNRESSTLTSCRARRTETPSSVDL